MCTLHNYRYPGVCPRAPIFISITVTRTQIPDPLTRSAHTATVRSRRQIKQKTFAQMRSIVKLHSTYDPILGSKQKTWRLEEMAMNYTFLQRFRALPVEC